MKYRDPVTSATRFAGDTLAEIGDAGLVPNPINFMVLYNDNAGHIPELSQDLRTLRAAEGLSDSECERLYEVYFGTAAERADLERASGEIMDRLTEALAAVGDASSSIGDFGTVLSEALPSLHEGGDVTAVVNALVEGTRRMQEQNMLLQTRLQVTSSEMERLHLHLEETRQAAETDGLTGLANRRRFDQGMIELTRQAWEEGTALCLLAIDIDHFKSFNDTYGHQVGDQVLRLVGHLIKENVKGQDLPARYGGEEFFALLPNTSLHNATELANRLRETVANKKIVRRQTGEELRRVTVSIGVSLYRPGEESRGFLERADQALYAAKEDGRNRVVSEKNLLRSVA